MYMIQIEEKKMDKLSDHIEQSLKHMGKAMQCVEEWIDENGMGERGGYGGRGGYGNREQGGRYSGGSMGQRYPMYNGYGMGYKDEEDWEEDPMGERRGQRRNSRGRYM